MTLPKIILALHKVTDFTQDIILKQEQNKKQPKQCPITPMTFFSVYHVICMKLTGKHGPLCLPLSPICFSTYESGLSSKKSPQLDCGLDCLLTFTFFAPEWREVLCWVPVGVRSEHQTQMIYVRKNMLRQESRRLSNTQFKV